jgi:hypothetical protein
MTGGRYRGVCPPSLGYSQLHRASAVQQAPVLVQRPAAHDRALDRPADIGPSRMRVRRFARGRCRRVVG